VCSVVLTVNSQTKSIKPHTKHIGFVFDLIDFACELTVETTEHTVASYESSDFI
jgi:hypothetical protein